MQGRLGCLEHDRGDLESAYRHYRRALELSEKTRSRLGAALVPAYLARLVQDQGGAHEAMDWCQRAHQASTRLQLPEGAALALSCHAAVLCELGAHGQAQQMTHEAHHGTGWNLISGFLRVAAMTFHRWPNKAGCRQRRGCVGVPCSGRGTRRA